MSEPVGNEPKIFEMIDGNKLTQTCRFDRTNLACLELLKAMTSDSEKAISKHAISIEDAMRVSNEIFLQTLVFLIDTYMRASRAIYSDYINKKGKFSD